MKVYFFNKQGQYFGASAEREECPEDATTVVPNSLFDKWDGEKWITDTTAKKAADDEAVKAKLADIDLKSIRSIREWLAKQPDCPKWIENGKEVSLKDIDDQAATERGKLK